MSYFRLNPKLAGRGGFMGMGLNQQIRDFGINPALLGNRMAVENFIKNIDKVWQLKFFIVNSIL